MGRFFHEPTRPQVMQIANRYRKDRTTGGNQSIVGILERQGMGRTAGRNERRSGCLYRSDTKYVDVEELTQTIVNEYIKKIIVCAPDKSSVKRKQKVKIFFNFVDDVNIPVISEPIITQTTYERRKTA